MKAKSVTILGRTWFDRVNGNTYHSARVFVDGKHVATVPFQYGYGNQFEWNAVDALERANIFKGKQARQRNANGSAESGWSWLRDRLGLGYLVSVSECLKRECVAFGRDEL